MIKFAPHAALTIIARGKLTFDERVVLHFVAQRLNAERRGRQLLTINIPKIAPSTLHERAPDNARGALRGRGGTPLCGFQAPRRMCCARQTWHLSTCGIAVWISSLHECLWDWRRLTPECCTQGASLLHAEAHLALRIWGEEVRPPPSQTPIPSWLSFTCQVCS